METKNVCASDGLSLTSTLSPTTNVAEAATSLPRRQSCPCPAEQSLLGCWKADFDLGWKVGLGDGLGWEAALGLEAELKSSFPMLAEAAGVDRSRSSAVASSKGGLEFHESEAASSG
jgi:hypothetical protein